jgi:hypothetical protein
MYSWCRGICRAPIGIFLKGIPVGKSDFHFKVLTLGLEKSFFFQRTGILHCVRYIIPGIVFIFSVYLTVILIEQKNQIYYITTCWSPWLFTILGSGQQVVFSKLWENVWVSLAS